MWPRVIELFLGIWLAISPFVFSISGDETFLWANDFTCAAWLAFFSLLSFGKSFEKAHLLNLPAGLWLIAAAFLFKPSPPPPAYQNFVVTGFLVLLISILPSRSDQIPRSWRKHYEQKVECELKKGD